jgi:hypothetical protein
MTYAHHVNLSRQEKPASKLQNPPDPRNIKTSMQVSFPLSKYVI